MNIKLGDDGGGPRHFLDGKPISCGTQLQLQVKPVNGAPTWVWARYEAVFDGSTPRAVFYTMFGRVSPDGEAIFRWPPS